MIRKRAHPAQQQHAVAGTFGGDGVGQPGVAVVHPPDDGQHHGHTAERGEVVALGQHLGELREDEDEDEIEEELEG